MLINKYEQAIQELNKKLNENEEKNRIKKDNEVKRYEQEIQKLNKKLNDHKNKEEEKIYGNIPYLETEEKAAENIADIYEPRDNKARILLHHTMLMILTNLMKKLKNLMKKLKNLMKKLKKKKKNI